MKLPSPMMIPTRHNPPSLGLTTKISTEPIFTFRWPSVKITGKRAAISAVVEAVVDHRAETEMEAIGAVLVGATAQAVEAMNDEDLQAAQVI